MKTTTTILFSLLSLVWMMSGACAAMMEGGDTPFLTKKFTMDAPGDLEVKTSGGSIKVASHPGNEVIVEMYVRQGSRNFENEEEAGMEALEDFKIDIHKPSVQMVSAIAERKNQNQGWFGGNNNVSVSFTVYVPREISCQLHTSGGSITLEGVSGKQDVQTSGGSLSLVDIKGDMNAKTAGGSINIANYAGILNAHTSGGSINLKEAKGDLVVHTSGGSINIENVTGSLDASTSGGSINANFLALEKALKLKTSGGSITAVIPSGLGLDLDLKGNRVNTKLQNFNGEAKKDRIRGSMNGGGIPVVMATSGGSVNLKYQ